MENSPGRLSHSATLASLHCLLRQLPLANLFGPELRYACDQLHRHRLGKRKAQRSFAYPVCVELTVERSDHRIARRIYRVVLFPSRKIQEHPAVQLKRRYLVGDAFL